MNIVSPLGHDETIRRLWRAAQAGRLPHALLFEGRAGIGKFTAAKWLAMGCLCARGPGVPCGECGPCKRVTSGGERGNHADLFVIDPIEEKEERIRIARIAERGGSGDGDGNEPSLEVFLGLRPLEGAWRVVLIRECHRMGVPAQNALLKTLEEPRPGTLMILETHRPATLLATIKSRCIRVRFGPLSRTQCEEVLVAGGLEVGEAQALARLAEGSPGLALGMVSDGTRLMRPALAAALLGEKAPQEVAVELWGLEGEYPGKTPSARDRERCRVLLDLALALVRDAWRAKVGLSPDSLPHGDVAEAVAKRLSEREILRRGEALAAARSEVDQNLAPVSLLERAILVMAEGPVETSIH